MINKEKDILESDPERDVWQLYLFPRHADVDKIYLSEDPDEIMDIIKKYNIEYIVLGNIEYKKYDYDNTATLEKICDVAFSYDNLNVYKVKDS